MPRRSPAINPQAVAACCNCSGRTNCDHLPLYRQSVIHARKGVHLERSTLADWVASSAYLPDPLVQALSR